MPILSDILMFIQFVELIYFFSLFYIFIYSIFLLLYRDREFSSFVLFEEHSNFSFINILWFEKLFVSLFRFLSYLSIELNNVHILFFFWLFIYDVLTLKGCFDDQV